jgi:hypothetical protein
VCTLAVAIICLSAVPGHAQELVEYQFKGVVIDNSGNLGVLGPFNSVQLNDEFTGRFSYMTGPGNPDQELGDPELGAYNIVDFVIDQALVTITPMVAIVTHRPGILTLPPLPPDLGTEGFSVIGSYLSGQDTRSVSLVLEAPYQAVFTDDSLPITLTLSSFTDSQIVRSIRVLGIGPDGMSQIDEGQLTLLERVPEPSAVALILMGMGIGVSRMRRRN